MHNVVMRQPVVAPFRAISETDRATLEPLMPLLITPGAAEALSVKIYRLVKVAGKTPLEAVKLCLDGYQNPVAAEVTPKLRSRVLV